LFGSLSVCYPSHRKKVENYSNMNLMKYSNSILFIPSLSNRKIKPFAVVVSVRDIKEEEED
jgi:hypothetical protein